MNINNHIFLYKKKTKKQKRRSSDMEMYRTQAEYCGSPFGLIFKVTDLFIYGFTSVSKLYIQFVKVLYCKMPTNSKQLPAFFSAEVGPGTEPESQRWEVRALPLSYRGPFKVTDKLTCDLFGLNKKLQCSKDQCHHELS